MDQILEINSRCINCDNCRILCPEDSIFVEQGYYSVENWSCTLCGICIEVCPVDCIKIVEVEAEND